MLLRQATEDDIPAILAVLREPAVATFWGENTTESVREELGVSWAIVVEDEVVGILLIHEETEPDYRHVAYDIAVAARFHGTGLGRRVLREAIRSAIDAGHHRFTIDPRADNEAAIRSYAAVGFKPVGIMRESDRDRDGTWRDGLLMDLLAREFVDG